MGKKEILQSMLNATSNKYDKREGSFIYDALAPTAEEIEILDNNLGKIKDKLDIRNLKGEELTIRVKNETGTDRKLATRSKGKVELIGTGTINVNDLAETQSGIQFRITETKNIVGSGIVDIEAVIPGTNGNVPSNTITLFPVTIAGFTAINNSEPTTGGFEEESDEDLLERHFEKRRTPATSGNKAHYRNWAKEVPGVGDAKTFPLWAGDNTVKVVIINAEREPASVGLVETVQEYIDPNSSGLGEGQANLGAYCTVISATEKTINVEFDVILEPGYTLIQVQLLIEESLTHFLRSIAFKANIVSYALIGANIINTEGVIDYANLLVNNGTANVVIGEEETPVLGVVTIA